ncbi:hypothetical protein O6P43_008507 [Quillaja saponaria]|uniref:Uncharacterized protein n=1 Tax=Quillaja saponaria TaxID=32244 RepID=A0AAD7M5F4_QUISA|nr:hypothetical protein O6P43_008507 [Quillaja saponaria]
MGLPASKQICGTADGDDILASFLQNKSKKRKLEFARNATHLERDAVKLNPVTGHEDGDITLASFLGNKSKKQFQAGKGAIYSRSSSGSRKGIRFPSKEVHKPLDENEMLPIMQSGESGTCCDDGSCGELSLSNLQSNHLKNMPIITN